MPVLVGCGNALTFEAGDHKSGGGDSWSGFGGEDEAGRDITDRGSAKVGVLCEVSEHRAKWSARPGEKQGAHSRSGFPGIQMNAKLDA